MPACLHTLPSTCLEDGYSHTFPTYCGELYALIWEGGADTCLPAWRKEELAGKFTSFLFTHTGRYGVMWSMSQTLFT